ncbi:uncharacterized protein LOC124203341 [Daphnia pulex]|uniref:uncharacterized protein LOC124203341 n=1 Tax=Daphnia pulex TaxID=6669 RepID=UPI001EE0CD9A|nr:uncharacterized protein LOC124203341 [Daphnia pulex]
MAIIPEFQNQMRYLAVTVEQDAYSEVSTSRIGNVGSSLPTSAALTDRCYLDTSRLFTRFDDDKEFFRFQILCEAEAITGSSCRMILEPRTYFLKHFLFTALDGYILSDGSPVQQQLSNVPGTTNLLVRLVLRFANYLFGRLHRHRLQHDRNEPKLGRYFVAGSNQRYPIGAGSWIESFVRLKNISIFSDDLAQKLTDLVRDQLAYSIPPFWDQRKLLLLS